MARVLVDTSAIYALLDQGDACHRKAKQHLVQLQKVRKEPILTNFIVAECHALLLSRLGRDFARAWLLSNVWFIERVNVEDEQKARRILSTYSDKNFSLTDALSFSVMERLKIKQAFAFDQHFRQYGFFLIE